MATKRHPVEIPIDCIPATIHTRAEALALLEECSGLLFAAEDCRLFGVPLPELLVYDCAQAVKSAAHFLREREPVTLSTMYGARDNGEKIGAAFETLMRMHADAYVDDRSLRTPDGLGHELHQDSLRALKRLADRLTREVA